MMTQLQRTEASAPMSVAISARKNYPTLARILFISFISRILLLICCVMSDRLIKDHEPSGVDVFGPTLRCDMAETQRDTTLQSKAQAYSIWYPLITFAKWDSVHYLHLSEPPFSDTLSITAAYNGSYHGWTNAEVIQPILRYFFRAKSALSSWIIWISDNYTTIHREQATAVVPHGALESVTDCLSALVVSSISINILFYLCTTVVLYYLIPIIMPCAEPQSVRSQVIHDMNKKESMIHTPTFSHLSIMPFMILFFCSPANVFSIQGYTESLYSMWTWSAMFLLHPYESNRTGHIDSNRHETKGNTYIKSQVRHMITGVLAIPFIFFASCTKNTGITNIVFGISYICKVLTESSSLLRHSATKWGPFVRTLFRSCIGAALIIAAIGPVILLDLTISKNLCYDYLLHKKLEYGNTSLMLESKDVKRYIQSEPWSTLCQALPATALASDAPAQYYYIMEPQPANLKQTVEQNSVQTSVTWDDLIAGNQNLQPVNIFQLIDLFHTNIIQFRHVSNTSITNDASDQIEISQDIYKLFQQKLWSRLIYVSGATPRQLLRTMVGIDGDQWHWISALKAIGSSFGNSYRYQQNYIYPAYSYLQSKYWNIGLFNQWTLRQVPNILLGLPALLLACYTVYHWEKRFFKSPKKQTQEVCVTDNLGKIHRATTFASSTMFKKALIHLKTNILHVILYQPRRMHMLLHILLVVLWAHVQVGTRLLFSSCPDMFVTLYALIYPIDALPSVHLNLLNDLQILPADKADIYTLQKKQNHKNTKQSIQSDIRNAIRLIFFVWETQIRAWIVTWSIQRWTQILVVYLILFNLLGIIMHVNWYPWT